MQESRRSPSFFSVDSGEKPFEPASETKQIKEFTFHIGGIVISGDPGTGKTKLIDMISKRYAIPAIKVGDKFFRKIAQKETGESIVDFYNRDVHFDLKADKEQIGLFQEANLENPFILESKLGGFFVYLMRKRAEKQGIPPPPIVTVLLTGDPETLHQRVYKRECKKNPDLTRVRSDELTEHRKEEDLKLWQEVYLKLQQIDLQQPNLYDIVIDTTHLSVKGVRESLIKQLVEGGYIEEKVIAPSPAQTQTFPHA